MRDAVSTSYAIATAYVISLLILGFLQWIAKPRKIPANVQLLTTLGSLVLGIAAVAYPALAIPGAANADLTSVINGFSGSVFIDGPGNNDFTQSWGAAAGWWMWLGAMLLSLIVFVVPLLQRKPWSRATPAH